MNGTEEERELLAVDNLKLVYSFVNRYHGKMADKSELESIALLGYAKAIKTHDPTKGAFSTFAYTCMHGEMADYLRSELKKYAIRFTTHLDYSFSNENETKNSKLADVIADKECKYQLFEVQEAIKKVTGRLDDEEKQIFNWILDGIGQREMAKLTGNSLTWVHNRVKKIRERMRVELGIS